MTTKFGPWIGVPKENQLVCAVEGCERTGVAHPCPYDGSHHHHGCVHYGCEAARADVERSGLVFRSGGWCLLCDLHFEALTKPWVRFTKRTEDPKLAWLERKLAEAGIESRRNGYSFHAPVLEVRPRDLDRAWAILSGPLDESGRVVDDVPDDDPVFQEH